VQKNGGLHFTYMKSPEDVSKKITAFEHTEYDSSEFTSINSIKSRMKNFRDPYDRDYQLRIVDINNSFPDYIVNNQKKYAHIIFRE
jgi:beta-1,4-mannosyl-glycoprotein beta-1,4-N-acetylglucosaminyltransferase